MMKRLLKYAAITMLAMLTAAFALALHTWYARPLSINWFYSTSFLKFALHEPELLTGLRILEPLGMRSHNALLSDSSPAGDERRGALLKATRETFNTYGSNDLLGQAAISHAVFAYSLKEREEEHRWRTHSHPVTQLFGPHTSLPSLMINQQHLDDQRDALYFITRMEAFPAKMKQLVEQIELRERLNIVPPKFAVEKSLVQVEEFVAKGVDRNPIYVSFVERIDRLTHEVLSAEKKLELKARARVATEQSLLPAYNTLQAKLRALQKVATKNEGAWSMPDGAAYYQYAIERHTTTRMSADALHVMGIKEVVRIGTEMDAILEKIEPSAGTRAQKILRITQDPRRAYPDTNEGRAQVLHDFQAIIDEIEPEMSRVFRLKPSSKVVVKRVPQFSEKGAPAAYYEPPPHDGSAPGVFYANLFNVNATPKHGMRTLAYHEAIPGHHFQIAIAQSLKELPFFRNVIGFTAYDEGWALYAERLGWELGFEKDPYDNLGRLQDEMMRAVRLVVDTGIHAKRWTREQAIEYMVTHTGMSEPEVVTEIERYFVDPGQALAYKVGMFKILELRERAQTKLGSRFDLRDFHDTVLGSGSLPMSILERVVDDYIAATLRT